LHAAAIARPSLSKVTDTISESADQTSDNDKEVKPRRTLNRKRTITVNRPSIAALAIDSFTTRHRAQSL
jgi:hypothetical protein